MSVDVAAVELWGDLVGAVSWNESRANASFEYDPTFISGGIEVAPIVMPLAAMIYNFPALDHDAFRGLPGLLADSLPDCWGTEVFNRWLATRGRPIDSYTPVERLLYLGTRGMGALEYKPEKRGIGRSETVIVDSLADLANEVVQARADVSVELGDKGLETLLQVGTSAGGVRAKAVVAWNRETQEMRSGQVNASRGFEYWIIKFDGVGAPGNAFTSPEGYGRVEMAYYLMATQAGIDMSQSQLFVDGAARAHFMTKRFDRRSDGSKIHSQTYQALTHRDYNQTGRHSWEDALLTTVDLCGFADAERLYRRMVFNVMARNQDDHTKNIGYVMDPDGSWWLAPAYDVTYAHDPGNQWTAQHQMTINAKQRDISRQDLLDVAKNVGIRRPRKILLEVHEAVSSWDDYADEAAVPSSFHQVITMNLRNDL